MLDPSSSSSSENESQFDSEDEVPQKKPTIALYDKDSDEEELERLVLGNKAGFRAQLFKDDGIFDSSWGAEGRDLQLVEQDPGLEEIDDADLFMFDTGTGPGAAEVTKAAKPTDGNAPVWEDSDDDRLAISLAGAARTSDLIPSHRGRAKQMGDLASEGDHPLRLTLQQTAIPTLRFLPSLLRSSFATSTVWPELDQPRRGAYDPKSLTSNAHERSQTSTRPPSPTFPSTPSSRSSSPPAPLLSSTSTTSLPPLILHPILS
ncbi:Uncharacterized protein HZ326_15093 [Fusarium oxysporum f. sp. albedinis]|nr:Uncharacterized protein HZ326_15093 [Fusarium oxysporum f. sp. albedinis]